MIYYLAFLSILPVIVGIMWIYFCKKYSKESIKTAAKFFLLGIFMSVFIIFVEEVLIKFNTFSGWLNIFYMSFIVAGFVEEGFKALVLIPALIRKKEFARRIDGITYSVYLSLGFAAVENLIYIITEERHLVFRVALNRAFISIPAHIMFGITMGYYISRYKFCETKKQKRKFLALSFLVPIILHGLFDFILMTGYKWTIAIFIVYTLFLLKINMDKFDDFVKNSKKIFINNKKKEKNIAIKKIIGEKNNKLEKEKYKIFDDEDK